MKKIILMMLLLPNIVFASVAFTDYEEYLMGFSEYIESSDVIKREEYKVYNTYFEEIIEKYATLEDKLEDYKIDYNDSIISKKNNLEKTIYTKSYEMKCLDENNLIGSFTLDNFSSDIKLNELEVIFNNETIKYGTYFTNYQGYSPNLFDQKFDNYTVTFFKETGKLYLGFMKKTKLNNITLKFYFPEQDIESISFDFKIDNKYIQHISLNLEKNQNNVITVNFEKEYNNFLLENNFLTNNKCITYYHEEIPLYKHSKTNIIPLNNYIKVNDNNLFLLDDYKIKYNYYKRDRIEIKDDIYLNNELFDINNYIISSTIPIKDLRITENINYEKTGIYQLKIFYKEKLIIETPIVYEINKQMEDKIINEKEETVIVNDQTSKNTKQKENIIKTTMKINKTTIKQTIKNINNQVISSNTNNNYKIKSIIIISILILILVIFEIILLYVKHRYF